MEKLSKSELGLKFFYKPGLKSYEGFQYKLGFNKCSDWKPKPRHRNRFYFFPQGQGNFYTVTGYEGEVGIVEYNPKKIVEYSLREGSFNGFEGKAEAKELNLVFVGTREEAFDYMEKNCEGFSRVCFHINRIGSKFYFFNGLLHRKDGPAIIRFNKMEQWYQHGKLHREEGPANTSPNGYKEWYQHDKLYRENGPAVECRNGDKLWYLNGELGREDGPAIEQADGTKKWYKNGLLHREKGAAVEWTDGDREWWVNGKRI